MEKVTLTRKQLHKIDMILKEYPGVQHVAVYETHTSGIGPTTILELSRNETVVFSIDITDFDSW